MFKRIWKTSFKEQTGGWNCLTKKTPTVGQFLRGYLFETTPKRRDPNCGSNSDGPHPAERNPLQKQMFWPSVHLLSGRVVCEQKFSYVVVEALQ